TEQANARLAAMVESNADAILGAALDGTITTWNDGAERLFGYSREEAIGQPLRMLAPPEERAELALLFDRVRGGEWVVNHEGNRRRKDGARQEIAVTMSPVRDAAGAIVGVSNVVRNVSESSERWRLAAEAAHMGMWCWILATGQLTWTAELRR